MRRQERSSVDPGCPLLRGEFQSGRVGPEGDTKSLMETYTKSEICSTKHIAANRDPLAGAPGSMIRDTAAGLAASTVTRFPAGDTAITVSLSSHALPDVPPVRGTGRSIV